MSPVAGSFSPCTVTVYRAGATALAAIYDDAAGTAKGNPFPSSPDGRWHFYAQDGQYDIRFSDGAVPARPVSGAASRQVSAAVNEFSLSARQFGSVGDGVADDTASLQAALNAAALDNRTLYIPPGTYKVGHLVLQPQNGAPYISVNLVGGSNYGQTKIDCSDAGPCLKIIDDRYFILQSFLVANAGASTTGLLITTALQNADGAMQGTLVNVGAGNFTAGSGIQFGETADGHAASEMTVIGAYIYNSRYGVEMEAPNTGAFRFETLRVFNCPVGLRSLDATFPLSLAGVSMSGNGIDFQLLTPIVMTVHGMISEGQPQASYGTLLEVGTPAGSITTNLYRITLEGVDAFHNYSMNGFLAMAIYDAANITIRGSRIGNGYTLLKGTDATRKSRISVENSSLWYGPTAPAPGYYQGGGFPIVRDPAAAQAWFVSLHGVSNDGTAGNVVLNDQDFIWQPNGAVVNAAH
jgi:hypothetical protein